IIETLGIAFSFLFRWWWLWLPPVLIFVTLEAWLFYKRQQYISKLQWVLLEVSPPPDVQKSPKIAENFFSALHGVYPAKGTIFKKTFFEGRVPDWFSFEIVGDNGDMRFYIRSPQAHRNLMESQIFAQYPDAEIKVADDYVTSLPESLPNEEYELFGTELIFAKEQGFPIKTYPFFEEESGKDEFKRSDPLSSLAEIMSSLGPGEHVWVQLVSRPTGADWAKEQVSLVEKLAKKEAKPKDPNILIKAMDQVESLLGIVSGDAKEEKKKEDFSIQKLTGGEKFVLDQVENKVAKLAFKSGIRFIYIAKKDMFNRSRVSSVTGMFKQLYSNNLNTFKPNTDTITFSKGYFSKLFPSDRGLGASEIESKLKRKLYRNYRSRSFTEKFMILSTEELATLFHLPGLPVKAPAFPRVEAKKGQPPAGLPTK
ncbi:MAG: hypothetical protein Q8P35_02800, partial [Candidatus Yanofskybacteria bacterium]|nr:hypothetical protein [Candidatus Yanofskybacteria bacterium]